MTLDFCVNKKKWNKSEKTWQITMNFPIVFISYVKHKCRGSRVITCQCQCETMANTLIPGNADAKQCWVL